MVPFREFELEFDPTLYDTVPLPFPLDPPVTEIHELFEEAVQVQPLSADTETVAVPPFASKVRDVGEML